MKNHRFSLRSIATTALILFTTASSFAQTLGTAGSYGALGGSTVTNTGNTVITGGLGVSPGSAITGFSAIDGGPGLFTGALNQGNGPTHIFSIYRTTTNNGHYGLLELDLRRQSHQMRSGIFRHS